MPLVAKIIDLDKYGLDTKKFFRILIEKAFEGKLFSPYDTLRILNKNPVQALADRQIKEMIEKVTVEMNDLLVNSIPIVIKKSGINKEDYDNADTKEKENIVKKVLKFLTTQSKARYFIVNEAIKPDSGMHIAKLMYTLSNKKEVKECMDYVLKKAMEDNKIRCKLLSKNDKIYKFEFTDISLDCTFKSNFIILSYEKYQEYMKYYKICEEQLVSDVGVELND